MDGVVIVAAGRTAIGSFNGVFSHKSAIELGGDLIQGLLAPLDFDPTLIDEVILGNVLQAGLGQNPAKQAGVAGGLPQSLVAYTVNKVCGSGLKSVTLATQALRLDDADIVLAGGIENMTQSPYLLPQGRSGYRLGDGRVTDTIVGDGLTCAFNHYHMGITAENVAEKYAISRQEQDQMALESQQKAAAAMESGAFDAEIIPISVKNRRETVTVDQDEHPRKESTLESLAKLRPAFTREGTVTAGNASGINDGAAALLMMKESRAKELGLTPLARIHSYASSGVDPALMGLGPVCAIHNALKRGNMSLDQIDLFELNEAFAAQFLGVNRELNIPPEKINIHGGAIALGHPIGASGARILVTLIHALRAKDKQWGVASLCIGGGQGVAVVIESLNR